MQANYQFNIKRVTLHTYFEEKHNLLSVVRLRIRGHLVAITLYFPPSPQGARGDGAQGERGPRQILEYFSYKHVDTWTLPLDTILLHLGLVYMNTPYEIPIISLVNCTLGITIGFSTVLIVNGVLHINC